MADRTRVFSIKEINRYIGMKLESDGLLSDVWLRGEISNFTHHSSGHMYFTLKDKDSRLKCIMFASHNQRLPFIPKEGAKVLARGNVSVYERDGNYQFYCTSMQPDGVGSLYLAYEQLKRKLQDEGLFDAVRKRPIPKFPKAIGVITSATGAAVRDILITLQRRHPSVPVLLFPVSVQGTGAAPSIVKAIENMNRLGEVDVLIIGRGGGSLEELWAFNEEAVARSIAASRIPVISAVGHETDFTIADFVADLRAATPTAAAELAVTSVQELQAKLAHMESRLTQMLRMTLQGRQERLARLRRSPVFLNPRKYVLQQTQLLDVMRERLRNRALRLAERNRVNYRNLHSALSRAHPGARAALASKQLHLTSARLEASMAAGMKGKRLQLLSSMRQLDALSPLKVMSRGYSLVYDEHGNKLVKSVSDVQLGDLIHVKVSDGQLECQVWGLKGEA
ncbi:exodeoxyribonuclease VII large subunit [Paenibacillus sacheonensis]|uniref:Exodeoxyribonuclease 7 large subunit n=1 Tax=Paenibacillus sacheonensis TaxID=742054 RepID=A0A7X5BW11_9BACL|nr:exodeoxyribonuclease VII large subunit [Paenibacillus sacheonensis]MBM7564380.1 exodeoxyribonuclease VII large subunit [Paenibacillus sacheonensis]NBC68943.1 exodeoxyribonuclease VII large subunit [Paenibacillus sacheonensis]